MHVPRDDSTWIQTFTGKMFHPLDPRSEEIDIRDIAHALSLKCRFTGHCKEFYSVAEHSVRCAMIVETMQSEHCLYALLHDAAEAYTADVATPVKRHMPDFAFIEARLMQCVCVRFSLPLDEPPVVKQADRIMLATERRDLMPAPPRAWRCAENVEPWPDEIKPWSPRQAELAFLGTFERLTK